MTTARSLAPWLLLLVAASGCGTRTYTYYLVDPEPPRSEELKEEGTLMRPFAYGSTTAMKVRWNDGDLITEVDIPMVASGQRIVIEHGAGHGDVKTIPATRLVPPPPTKADASLIEAYRARGLAINEDAADVSIVRARGLMRAASEEGNYALALEWAETVLERYPSQPEFLRAKASLLLMMGEKAKAIEVYEQAESIESDPSVRKKLEELQQTER